MFEPLPDDVASALARAALDLGTYAAVRYQSEIGSTNDAALALAAAGAPEGTSVLADIQTSGRGRRGRQWFSPAGSGLYVSIVVRPNLQPDVVPIVTLAAGVAVATAIRDVIALPVELKWPNDIVIGRPWRKIGGVLSEAASVGPRLDAVVIGIGVNVRASSFPPELASRATSLETELGRDVERAACLIAVLGQLRAIMTRLREDGRDVVCEEWRGFGRRGLSGSPVRWEDRGAVRRGRAIDIAADGALLVDVAGRTERVLAGEVTWE